MKCPVCSVEMEKGFLQAGDIMVWVKKKHHLSLLPGEGEVLLDRKYLTNCTLPAWICKACRKVVAEYEEKDDFAY